MAVVVAFVSQKGGVGKSTLARALAVAASRANVKVMVADLDAQQSTAWHWNEMRSGQKLSPPLNVVTFDTIDEALAAADSSELLIVDTSGHASRATLDIARHAHLACNQRVPGSTIFVPVS